jgi:hypothetical protein
MPDRKACCSSHLGPQGPRQTCRNATLGAFPPAGSAISPSSKEADHPDAQRGQKRGDAAIWINQGREIAQMRQSLRR